MSRLSLKQAEALSMMARARANDPNTDDALVASCPTFYDAEIAVAYVHWRTAQALIRRGLARIARFGYGDEGDALELTGASFQDTDPTRMSQ